MRRSKQFALAITSVLVTLGLVAVVSGETSRHGYISHLSAAYFNATCGPVIIIDVLFLLVSALGWLRGIFTKQPDLKKVSGSLFATASICILAVLILWTLVAFEQPTLKDSFRLVPVRSDADTIDR